MRRHKETQRQTGGVACDGSGGDRSVASAGQEAPATAATQSGRGRPDFWPSASRAGVINSSWRRVVAAATGNPGWSLESPLLLGRREPAKRCPGTQGASPNLDGGYPGLGSDSSRAGLSATPIAPHPQLLGAGAHTSDAECATCRPGTHSPSRQRPRKAGLSQLPPTGAATLPEVQSDQTIFFSLFTTTHFAQTQLRALCVPCRRALLTALVLTRCSSSDVITCHTNGHPGLSPLPPACPSTLPAPSSPRSHSVRAKGTQRWQESQCHHLLNTPVPGLGSEPHH